MTMELPEHSRGRRVPPSRRLVVSCVFCDINLKHRQSYQEHLKIHTKEKPYFCKICSKEIRQKNDLAYHIQLHRDISKSYNCNLCRRSFRLEAQLESHMKVHSNEEPFKCELCPKSYKTTEGVRTHMKGHNSKGIYTCDKCFRRFKYEHRLKQHIQSVHELSPTQQCPICKKSLSDSSAMSVHMRIHTGEKPYKYQLCEDSFTYSADLKRHSRKMHSTLVRASTKPSAKTISENNKHFACSTCPKKFANELYLTRHMFTHTHREKNYSCEICRLAFQTKEKLRIHGFYHSAKIENGMALCPVCEKEFTSKRFLIRHIQALHNRETYECDVCQKRFTNGNYLKKHMMRHTEEKGHKCSVCGKGFKTSNHRKTHEQTHLRKQHKCDICGREYHQPGNLRHHIQRLHGQDKCIQCLFCSKRFGFNRDLQNHIGIHTRKKPYICSNCQKEFSSSKSIKSQLCKACRV